MSMPSCSSLADQIAIRIAEIQAQIRVVTQKQMLDASVLFDLCGIEMVRLHEYTGHCEAALEAAGNRELILPAA